MAMELNPCDTCDRFTYNGVRGAFGRLCDPCLDALLYVRTASIEDLRDLITANGGGQ